MLAFISLKGQYKSPIFEGFLVKNFFYINALSLNFQSFQVFQGLKTECQPFLVFIGCKGQIQIAYLCFALSIWSGYYQRFPGTLAYSGFTNKPKSTHKCLFYFHKFLLQVISALEYLHTKLQVIHRDVKPSNILINRSGDVKMCDFGISGYLVDSVAKTIDAGCKPYMAVRGHSITTQT